MRDALRDFAPQIILSDFSLPQFNGLEALKIAREIAPDVPFIYVSGTIGEERAITALHSGAVDYVLKGNLVRLAPAVRRALDEASARRERRAEQARIARLDRVLRMLSGVNALLVRVRDRKELLSEICRLAVSVGGYAASVVYYKAPGAPTPQVFGCSGEEPGVDEALQKTVSESPESGPSVIDHVIKTANVFVCTDAADAKVIPNLQASMRQARLCSLVALPLLVDKTALGVLALAARDLVTLSKEELQMLREVSGNVSFAMQYLQKDTTVRFLSHFDPQTGLAKRALFCERLSRLIAAPAGSRSRYAVCVIDIERLSVINDSFGRRIGDLLLQHVADRIKHHFPQSEHIGHFGGGTFAFVRDLGTHTIDDILAAAREHGPALFGEPFIIEQRAIPVAVRSGLVIYPEHGEKCQLTRPRTPRPRYAMPGPPGRGRFITAKNEFGNGGPSCIGAQVATGAGPGAIRVVLPAKGERDFQAHRRRGSADSMARSGLGPGLTGGFSSGPRVYGAHGRGWRLGDSPRGAGLSAVDERGAGAAAGRREYLPEPVAAARVRGELPGCARRMVNTGSRAGY